MAQSAAESQDDSSTLSTTSPTYRRSVQLFLLQLYEISTTMASITLSRVALLFILFSSVTTSEYVSCRAPISTESCRFSCQCTCNGVNLACNPVSPLCNAFTVAACFETCICASRRSNITEASDTESKKSVRFTA